LTCIIFEFSDRIEQQTYSASVPTTSHLELHKEIITVSSEIYAKYLKVLCRQKVQFLNI